MALTTLTSLTAAQYRALNITSFPVPPSVFSTGSPDSRASFQLGGWVGTDVLAFTITEAMNSQSALTIDSINANTLDVNITTNSDPGTELTYWTVNMGAGASGSNWEISFLVEANSTNTGTWKFVKGKSADPKY